MNKAVFLDRDGTVSIDTENNGDPQLYINAKEGIRLLSGEYKIIIVTNQGGIAKGRHTAEDTEEFNAKLQTVLDASITAIYYCPHLGNCINRKPKPGMLQKASKEHEINLTESWMIGDKTSDIKAGINAGCKTIIVKTGEAGLDGRFDVKADYIAEDLLDAAHFILKRDIKGE